MLPHPLILVVYLSYHFRTVTGSCSKMQDRNIFLWSVEEPTRRSKSYLFGTIHVPYTAVWSEVSDRVKEAYERSDAVAFEVDLHNESTMRKLIRCKNLKRKQNVRTYLTPEMYQRLHDLMSNVRAAFEGREESVDGNMNKASIVHSSVINGWERKKPEWLLFLLYQLSENVTLRHHATPILDLFLAEKALLDGKKMMSIESVNEQCNPIATVSREQVLFSINYTLSYLERLYDKSPLPLASKQMHRLEDLVVQYKCGRLEHIVKNNSMPRRHAPLHDGETERELQIEELLKNDIIVLRNERIARRLYSLMQTQPDTKIFAAIGTGHFVGEGSVLEHLMQMGYTVKAVKEHDHIEYSNAPSRVNSLWVRSNPKDLLDVTLEVSDLTDISSITHAFYLSLQLALQSLVWILLMPA